MRKIPDISITSGLSCSIPVLIFIKPDENMISILVDKFGNISYIKLDRKGQGKKCNFVSSLEHFKVNINVHTVTDVKHAAELLMKYITKPKKDTNYPINKEGNIILCRTAKYSKKLNNLNVIFEDNADPDYMDILSTMKRLKTYGELRYNIGQAKYNFIHVGAYSEPQLHVEYLLYEVFMKDAHKAGVDISQEILTAGFNVFVNMFTGRLRHNDIYICKKKSIDYDSTF